jgi:hypothetical protein
MRYTVKKKGRFGIDGIRVRVSISNYRFDEKMKKWVSLFSKLTTMSTKIIEFRK